MNVIIFYFSSTGNTFKVAEYASRKLEKLGAKVELFNMENGTPPEISVYDKVGFAYPVHAFNAPQIVLKFASAIKTTQANKPLFILKTSGEPLRMNDVSSLKLVSILKRKGLTLKNEYHYIMPYAIIFRHTEAEAYRMYETAKKLIEIDSRAIYAGKCEKISRVPFGGALSFIMRIEQFGSKINGRLYRVNKTRCVKCMKCADNCPVGNIGVKNGKITFGGKCLLCTRCAFFCPTDAIRIGLFNGWRVNGAYSFSKPEKAERNAHPNYCKKSYLKYYREAEEKIASEEDCGNQ